MTDKEKLISIHGDISSQVNYTKGLMTNVMIDICELKEERKTIYTRLNQIQKQLDDKTNEIENLWRNL